MPLQDPNNPRRYLHSTSTKYEFQFGYSRAVRHGKVIRVAGTAGLDEDGNPLTTGIVDQTRRALEIVKAAIETTEASRTPPAASSPSVAVAAAPPVSPPSATPKTEKAPADQPSPEQTGGNEASSADPAPADESRDDRHP